MRLIDDWHWILRRAWSVRLMILAGVLSGIEVALSVLSAYQVNVPIAPGTFALISGLVTLAAFLARFVAQDHSS